MSRTIAAAVTLALAAGCGGSSPPTAAGVTVTLLEGLPHQESEAESLAEELKTKKTVTWASFPFYDAAIAPSDGDVARLRDLVAANSTYEPYRGPKKCGGFHPDWLVQVGSGDPTRALLCFGCGEVKVLGGPHDGHHDLADAAEKAFQAILEPYAKNRPPSRR